MPRLYSYVLREDTGFAPNPYHGFCTLACCKPDIRRQAREGDWIIGTGSSAKGKDKGGHISYAMRVTEIMTFDEYWNDERFLAKRPNLDGDLTEACGDNLYQFDYPNGCWCRVPAYHCDSSEMEKDTSVDRVLISDDFVYWGEKGPELPDFCGVDIRQVDKRGRGLPKYRCNFSHAVIDEVIDRIKKYQSNGQTGVCGKPLDLKDAEKLRSKAKNNPPK